MSATMMSWRDQYMSEALDLLALAKERGYEDWIDVDSEMQTIAVDFCGGDRERAECVYSVAYEILVGSDKTKVV